MRSIDQFITSTAILPPHPVSKLKTCPFRVRFSITSLTSLANSSPLPIRLGYSTTPGLLTPPSSAHPRLQHHHPDPSPRLPPPDLPRQPASQPASGHHHHAGPTAPLLCPCAVLCTAYCSTYCTPAGPTTCPALPVIRRHHPPNSP
jgi:hypothetical protein